jgi:hypothetical protein
VEESLAVVVEGLKVGRKVGSKVGLRVGPKEVKEELCRKGRGKEVRWGLA